MIDKDMTKEEMTAKLTKDEEMIALLPFYLSGTIETDDKALVEHWLETTDGAFNILEKIQNERHAAIVANEDIAVPRDGLARLMADIQVTRQEKTLTSHVRTEGGSFVKWFETSVLAPLRAVPQELALAACALLLVVTIGQSTLLYQGQGTGPGTGLELASGERYQFLSSAVVKFSDTATMSEIADTLDKVGAVIVDGPTASGQFVIGFIEREDSPALPQRYETLKSNKSLIRYFVLKAKES